MRVQRAPLSYECLRSRTLAPQLLKCGSNTPDKMSFARPYIIPEDDNEVVEGVENEFELVDYGKYLCILHGCLD